MSNQSSVTGAGTSPRDLLEQLKAVAPSVVFSVTRELDQNFQWDGDGPDPELEGFYAHDVTVTARAVAHGVLFEGHDYLGGSYFKHNEPCGDVHGYLPQMLSAAAEKLETQLGERGLLNAELATQLHNAVAMIQAESRQRYDEQMAASKGAS